MTIRNALLAVCVCVLSTKCLAQEQHKNIVSELTKLSQGFKFQAGLSFRVAYYHARINAPGHFLDSLKGSFKLKGNHFWYDLNETEAMGSDKYVVFLFKEDEMMYLAKPASMQSLNPLTVLDSMLSQSGQMQGKIESLLSEKKITLTFPPGSNTKEITYYIDNQSGMLTRMTSIVASKTLLDENADARAEEPYAIVDAFFSEYKTGDFSESFFNYEKYFQKVGPDYIPVAPYHSYKIFLGSPNL